MCSILFCFLCLLYLKYFYSLFLFLYFPIISLTPSLSLFFFLSFISSGKGSSKATTAKKVASALKKGNGRKATTVHTKVHFYKPTTLKLARNPKIETAEVKKKIAKAQTSKAYDIIKYPLTTETAMKNIEDSNTLVFIVALTATKAQIKASVKKLYSIEVDRVNTLIRPDGLKKAFVKLSADYDAIDVANKMGIV